MFGSFGHYAASLVGSWWFFACLAGTAFGIGAPFFPPLQSAVPLWLGLVIALLCWTLAPLRSYHQLRLKITQLEGGVTIKDVKGLVVNAMGESRVNITLNVTRESIALSTEPTSEVADVDVGWKDVTLEAPEVGSALEGGGIEEGPEVPQPEVE